MPTEQAQKGGDPAVQPPQGPALEDKARIILASKAQVKLPDPIREELMCLEKSNFC